MRELNFGFFSALAFTDVFAIVFGVYFINLSGISRAAV